MIVYGDPSFIASPAELRSAFERLGAARTLDSARERLILCGQVEQAIADEDGEIAPAQRATDHAADLFLAALHGEPLCNIDPFIPPTLVRLKIPEGFAFYTLLPEQYLTATKEWINRHLRSRRVLVIGIRSIGTSLSAVVAARLRREKIEVERITVRPKGHPFQREAAISFGKDFNHAIVVDEGPGLSGSSIAAVVSALHACSAAEITIFPGHDQPPGNAASDQVRELWRTTDKIVFPSLTAIQEELRTKTEEILKSAVIQFQDLSAGQWRSVVPGGATLPAVPQLERTKFLFRSNDGRALLWKFAGLGLGLGGWSLCEQAFHRQRRLSRMGWCQDPIATSRGFIATEWLQALPTATEDCDPPRARAIARYILDSSKPPTDQTENFARLRKMTLCNLTEGIGPEAADRAATLGQSACISHELPCYGDGRLAPYEWLKYGNRLVKTDVWGHDRDHTCIGEQTILWDIAGTLIEWKLNDLSEAAFRREFQLAGLTWPEPVLEFHKLAYKSFRLGIASLFKPLQERQLASERS